LNSGTHDRRQVWASYIFSVFENPLLHLWNPPVVLLVDQLRYGPGVDWACNRNQVKRVRCVRLIITSPASVNRLYGKCGSSTSEQPYRPLAMS
jgi:hypothetical protein